MLDFYKTGGGRRFCDATMPNIGRQLDKIAKELHRANNLKEVELGLRKVTPGDVAREFVKEDQNGSAVAFVESLGLGRCVEDDRCQ